MVSQEQEDAWNDTLDETDFDVIRSSPQVQVQADPRMLCDIQRVIGRLVSKSEQLLGKTKILQQRLQQFSMHLTGLSNEELI